MSSFSTKTGPSMRQVVQREPLRGVGRVERALLLREQLADAAAARDERRGRPSFVEPSLHRRRADVAAGHRVDLDLEAGRVPHVLGQLVRHDRPQLHHRVAARPWTPPRAHDDAGLVEREVGRVEEEDLPDLRVERIDARAPPIADRCASSGSVTFSSTLSEPVISSISAPSSSPGSSLSLFVLSCCHFCSFLSVPNRSTSTPCRRPRSLTVSESRPSFSITVRTMQAPARMTSARCRLQADDLATRRRRRASGRARSGGRSRRGRASVALDDFGVVRREAVLHRREVRDGAAHGDERVGRRAAVQTSRARRRSRRAPRRASPRRPARRDRSARWSRTAPTSTLNRSSTSPALPKVNCVLPPPVSKTTSEPAATPSPDSAAR